MKAMHWIGSKLCDLPKFDKTRLVDIFLAYMEGLVPKTKRIQAMDTMVKGTLARWWLTHHAEP
jgi:hypothetical protein